MIPVLVVVVGFAVGAASMGFLKRPLVAFRLCCWGVGLCVAASALDTLIGP